MKYQWVSVETRLALNTMWFKVAKSGFEFLTLLPHCQYWDRGLLPPNLVLCYPRDLKPRASCTFSKNSTTVSHYLLNGEIMMHAHRFHRLEKGKHLLHRVMKTKILM